MVVKYVTLFMRVTMRRPTGFSTVSSLVKAGFAAAIVLAAALSCSDSTSPKGAAAPALKYVEILVPDAIKNASGVPSSASGNVVVGSSDAVAAPRSPSLTSDVLPGTSFVKSKPDTVPEAAPTNRIVLPPPPGGNDGYVPDVPLGFNFSFYGNTYDRLNVFANGLVTFGPTDSAAIAARTGYFSADRIADPADPNNMIALSWSDWSPSRAGPDAIRYETRGTAPNRRFILQYTNVPEFGAFATLTTQLVLNEGSNVITIFTPSMSTTRSVDLITQGVENADGTDAQYDSTFHTILLVWFPRVRGFYKLTNDVVRFTPTHVNQPPAIVAPTDLAIATDLAACLASPKIDVPQVTDDAAGSSIAGVRSDGQPLDASYPKGVTTITWTATDAEGLTATLSQSVTVSDNESPSVTAPANISVRTDNRSTTATVAVGEATATDNCHDVTISGARSDNVPLSAVFPIGVTTITWTATDAAGNTGSAAQTVTVIGNVAPVLSVPANISLNTDPGVCSAIASVGTATATDDAPGTTVNGVRSDGLPLSAAYPKGPTNIVWTATDADGLATVAGQVVNVADREAPSVMSSANISVNNDSGTGFASVMVGRPLVSDNCPGVEVFAVRDDGGAVGSAYLVGVTVITWTARDASGNSASSEQSVTVTDIDAPSIVVPSSFSVNASSSAGAFVNFTVTASDNVAVASISCDHSSGSQFPLGSTLVTCAALDAAGNRSSGSFTITVKGPSDQLGNLIDYVIALGLPSGITNPLVNQLRSAFDSGAGLGCKKMDDFIDMVGKKDSGIPDANVAYMIPEARRIESAAGCGAAPSVIATKKPKSSKARTTILSRLLRAR